MGIMEKNMETTVMGYIEFRGCDLKRMQVVDLVF